jgi:hypothetical protein
MSDNALTVKPKSGKKTLKIEWPDNRWFQKRSEYFSFNIGNKDALTSWYEKAKTLERVEHFKDETALNDLYEIEKELITMILGEKSWKRIWKRSGNNVFAVLQIVQALSGMIKVGIDESIKMIQDEKSIN